MSLPASFRKLSLEERRNLIETQFCTPQTADFWKTQQTSLTLADQMVENAVGWFEVPLGIVPGFAVNGKNYDLPLATEEPSVIAAASYAARVLSRSREGGIAAWADEPLMCAQIFVESLEPEGTSRQEFGQRFEKIKPELESLAISQLTSLQERGGGWRGCEWKEHGDLGVFQVELRVDVRDALGANRLNTLAETLSPFLEKELGARKLMAILSNDASLRQAGAHFSIRVDHLAKPGFSGAEMARRIALAAALAQTDTKRAVTHNKGIMNGITALALATGNDTRALEAGVHSGAVFQGCYRGLSRYKVEEGFLEGQIRLPLALATVGGSVSFHPTAQTALNLLGNPSSQELCQIAAALGLAQNFAALFALTGEGIQQGHMNLHNRRKS